MAKRTASEGKKAPTKAEQILLLAKSGLSTQEIRHIVGCSYVYALQVRTIGVEEIRKRQREKNKRRRERRRPLFEERAGVRAQRVRERVTPILAAVERGISYAKVGEMFGLSKGAISGIVTRHGQPRRKDKSGHA